LNSVYKRDQENLLATLLKNERLSDFMDQVRNADSLNSKLTGLLADLKSQKSELDHQRENLEQHKGSLETLYQKQVSQKVSVTESKGAKDDILKVTKGEEARYQSLLSEIEKKKQQFFAELQSLEREALKSGAFIVHVTADGIPPKAKIFTWPYQKYYLTQSYGMTAYARRGIYGGAPHNGIDMASGFGSAIHPIGPGNILTTGTNDGWGNWASVRHDNGLVSVYAHMRAPSGLINGSRVTTSDIIGYEGSTGNSTGSHLHLSLYHDFFTYINPRNGQIYFNYFDGSLNPLDYL